MMVLTRSVFARMMSLMRRFGSDRFASSPRSWAAWLIAPMGLLISWAIEAESRPSAASLRLMDAIVEGGQVLEEDQHRRRLACAERREMRPHLAKPVHGEEVAARRVGIRAALAPHGQEIEQARRNLAEQCARRRVAAEDLACRLVDEPDAVLLVDDHEALAQPFDDVLRQLRQVREVEVALAHQRLALAQPPGERCACESGDQDDAAEQSRLRQVGRIGNALEPQHQLLAEHAERGDCGDRRRRALGQQQAHARDGHDEQKTRHRSPRRRW